MDESTMTAPQEFAPGDTTYVGQSAYTVVTNERGEQVVLHVQEADVAALEVAGYTHTMAGVVTPSAATESQPEPTPEPQSAPAVEPAPEMPPAAEATEAHEAV